MAFPRCLHRLRLAALVERAAIVADVDAQPILWIFHLSCRDRGDADDVVGFIVGGDKNVDDRQIGGIFRQYCRTACERPQVNEHAEKKQDQAIHFGKVQQCHADKIQWPGINQTLQAAPQDVAHCQIAGQQYEHQPPGWPLEHAQFVEHCHQQQAAPACGCLACRIEIVLREKNQIQEYRNECQRQPFLQFVQRYSGWHQSHL